MALRSSFVAAHIAKWEAALKSQYRPYREKWPSRLFHHAPVENAAKILADGYLRSRNDPGNTRDRDVAAGGVIESRSHAHESVRLYFRPRTPTQWHIEGIRKPGECSYGDAAHAPVLVMFVFDALRVLSQDGIQVCDRNMQLGSAVPSSDEAYFDSIPFDKVYHEGGTGGDRSIIEHRCAEVLAVSPLDLENGHLQWIGCRTAAEKATLLHLLGEELAARWSRRIIISDDLLVFERKYVFVEEVSLSPEGVVFQLSPRADAQAVDVRIRAWSGDGKEAVSFHNTQMAARPMPPPQRWRVPQKLTNGRYLIQIELEGHLAFKGFLTLKDGIF